MKVIFFGTPTFAAHVLKHLLDNKVNVVAVVTKPDKPKGRSGHPVHTPVKEVALTHHLPVLQPAVVSSPEVAPLLAAYGADLFVVVVYGEIIKQHLLEMPKLGCINIHPSILPKYRGAAPIHRAIIQGETETGVCIMYLSKKMDAGDVIHVDKVAISPEITCGEMEQILCKLGAESMLQTIRALEKGPVPRIPQDDAQVTFAPKIELEDCEIHWDKPAKELHNFIRGVTPHPGAWCWVKVRDQKLRLKILKSRWEEGAGAQVDPGTIVNYGKAGLTIACKPGLLHLVEIQLEGKKAMRAEELLRGIPEEHFQL